MSAEGVKRNWNELLGAKGVFPEDIATIKTDSVEPSEVLSELTELLAQEGVLSRLYAEYKKIFEKESDEARTDDSEHVELFKSKLLDFAVHNTEADNGVHSWSKGVNQFTDMTEKESSRYTGGVKCCEIPTESGEADNEGTELPPAPVLITAVELEPVVLIECEPEPEVTMSPAPVSDTETAPEPAAAATEEAPAPETAAAPASEAEPAPSETDTTTETAALLESAASIE